MATRKRKSQDWLDDQVDEINAAFADVVLKPGRKGRWPKITVGSHLTVYTFEDGRTELVWDDEQLLKEVRAAILKAESTMPVKAKTARRKSA